MQDKSVQQFTSIDKNIGKKPFFSDLFYHPLSSKCRNITHHESTTLWLNEPNRHCYPPLAPQSGAAATKNITSADYCATTKCRTKHHHYRRSYVSTARWMDHSFSVGPQLPLLSSLRRSHASHFPRLPGGPQLSLSVMVTAAPCSVPLRHNLASEYLASIFLVRRTSRKPTSSAARTAELWA